GTVKDGLYDVGDEEFNVRPVVEAAKVVLSKLNDEERSKSSSHIDSPDWRTWSNPEFLLSDKGVRLEFLEEGKRDSILELLKASLSEEGWVKAREAMRINGFLGQLVKGEKVMNEHSYNFALFGVPSEDRPWGYTFYGHHLCLNALFYRKQMVLAPWFTGAEPNAIDEGPWKGIQILHREEELGLQLMQSLNTDQREKAVIYKELKDSKMPPGRWNHDDQRHLCGAYQDNRIVPYEGIPYSSLSSTQQDLIRSIISEYLLYLPLPTRQYHISRSLAYPDETYFSWIGGCGPDDAFYYRVQSPTIVVEFDHHSGVFLTNTEPKKFHIHTLLRMPNAGDYGLALRRKIGARQKLFKAWEAEDVGKV
ncbi:hypothetical protein BT69DRAFT_1291253, partial [Atractiella rhizophila]